MLINFHSRESGHTKPDFGLPCFVVVCASLWMFLLRHRLLAHEVLSATMKGEYESLTPYIFLNIFFRLYSCKWD